MTAEWSAIVPTGPFDLVSTMECGQAFRWSRVSSPELGDHLEGIVFGNRVRAKQTGHEALFTSEPDDPAAFRPILEDYLGLNHDLDAIYAALGQDPTVARLIEKYPGLRVLRQDPWECLVSFICSANNNIPPEDRWSFPTPAALADAGDQALRDLRIGYKAGYIVETARRVANGDVDLFALREAEYGDALEAVTSLPGVADKIGNCVLLFSLDKLESFPVDVHIHRAMWDNYPDTRSFIPSPYQKPKRSLTRAQQVRLRQWAQLQDRFGPHAGYANQYLFYDDLLNGRGP